MECLRSDEPIPGLEHLLSLPQALEKGRPKLLAREPTSVLERVARARGLPVAARARTHVTPPAEVVASDPFPLRFHPRPWLRRSRRARLWARLRRARCRSGSTCPLPSWNPKKSEAAAAERRSGAARGGGGAAPFSQGGVGVAGWEARAEGRGGGLARPGAEGDTYLK